MADIKNYDPENGVGRASIEKTSSSEGNRKFSASGRHASVAESIVAADLLDERYTTTKRGLKSRHAQMIALGGTIGTGLFVGTGQVLATGGPAFILTTYILMVSIQLLSKYFSIPGAS
jgi:yeast amino acid transporter